MKLLHVLPLFLSFGSANFPLSAEQGWRWESEVRADVGENGGEMKWLRSPPSPTFLYNVQPPSISCYKL